MFYSFVVPYSLDLLVMLLHCHLQLQLPLAHCLELSLNFEEKIEFVKVTDAMKLLLNINIFI